MLRIIRDPTKMLRRGSIKNTEVDQELANANIPTHILVSMKFPG